jgi:hypothetical protein
MLEVLVHESVDSHARPVMKVTLAGGSKVPLWNTFKDQ